MLLGVLVLPALAGLWLLATRLEVVAPILLPDLPRVLESLGELLSDGAIAPHVARTVPTALLGFVFGSLAGVLMAGLLTFCGRVSQQTYSVMIVSLDAIPIVVMVPIVNTMFGFGMASGVLIASVSAFFPVFLTTFSGLAMVSADELKLLSSLRASRTQVMLKLRLPAALPAMFGGLRIAIAIATVATVIAELVGTDRGLGYLLLRFRGAFDPAGMWAVILVFAVIGALTFFALELVERKVVFWRR